MQEKSRILKKINNECFGGSENQLRLLLKHLPDESFKDINLILNNTNHDLIEKDKINVLWMHHFVNQKEAQNLRFKDFVNKLDWIVYNSNWNLEKHIYQFKVPESKCIVIKNAIEEINFEEKPKDKISLIYHTTPWRGLVHLLKVFKSLNLKNVEFRKAISHAIDRELIVKIAMNSYTVPAHITALSDIMKNWRGDTKKYDDWTVHDKSKSEKILHDLGYAADVNSNMLRDKDGNTVSFEIIVVSGWSDWIRAAQIISRDLIKVGIDASVRTYDFGAWNLRS